MPKKPIDYSKALIYKLCCNDLSVKDIYVGHTTDFTQRKRCHKGCCNNENDKKYNLKVYKMIRYNGGWENWSMVLVEKFSCADEIEAKKREQFWYESLNAQLNSVCPQRTKQQYNQDNKEILAERKKMYNEDNKEKIADYQKVYRELNKEELAEKQNEYRKLNKEKLAERDKTNKYTCKCGSCFRRADKHKHNKTKKHQQYLKFLNQTELTNS